MDRLSYGYNTDFLFWYLARVPVRQALRWDDAIAMEMEFDNDVENAIARARRAYFRTPLKIRLALIDNYESSNATDQSAI